MTIITERELLLQAKDALIDLMSGGTRYIDREGNITIEFDYTEAQKVIANIDAVLAAPATAPEELERLRQIAHLSGTIFCYGHFVAETHNERVLEKLLRENGTFWESVEQYEREQGRMS